MIRPFSEEDAWCYWVISVGALLSFLGFIVACICSCRRSETKNEFLGLAGMVTLNSAENESFAGIPNDVSARASVQDATDVGKRTMGANRSLPDIPKDRRHDDTTESVSQDIYETTETIADNSELYATVQGAGLATEVSEKEMQQQVDQRNSSIRKNSARRYSRFAVVASDNGRNEGTDKVEHPYAQLQDVQKIEANQGLNRGNVRSAIETKKPSLSVPTATSTSQGGETNPIAPPRTRRSSSHNSLLSDDIGSRGGEIQAATAISGGVQANQELPYMTPPLSMLLPSSQSQSQSATPSANLSQPQSQSQSQSQSESLSQSQPQSQLEPQPQSQSQSQPLRSCQQSHSPQQHFSGDSQDSKGYTSISVREPLANIIAQTKTICRQSQSSGRPLVDSHYATVSDDSDEMYAAIDEQDKVYTSGSETYAQIQPTTEAQRPTQATEPTSFPRAPSRSDEAQPAAPQPPSVDSLRHVAHAHSRQASSSSANSSIANPGSPKPEKRQANSPLPPPPEGTMDMYASIDKRISKTEERSKSTLSNGKSLEDMYAKVMKKKKEAEEQSDAAHASLYSGSLHHEVAAVSGTTAVAAATVGGTAAVRKTSLVEPNRTSWSSHDSAETQRKELDSAGCSFSSVNPDASKLLQVGGVVGEIDSYSSKDPRCSHDHGHNDYGYEAVASDPSKKRATRDPNYEPLRPQSNSTVDTVAASTNASTSGVAAAATTAASSVTAATTGYSSSVRNATDLAASYNALKHRQASNASSEDPGYEKVRLRRRIDADHDTDSEPNYESMPHDSGEPNYASVCRPGDSDTDPNYESVNHGDPNYESVKYMSVDRSASDDPPYEQVHGFKVDPNPDGYEQVKKHRGFYSADYERIQLNRFTESMGNGDTDDEQYVQV